MINDVNACVPKQDLKNMDPWIVIVEAARATGIQINKPKENCKKCQKIFFSRTIDKRLSNG